ncbi:MAG TPA: paraquat-inducible protein A [Saprospiraceae bacterium]|nr:paraquat-inducible protein A [Saprospiraceae bacterium]
MKNLRTIFIALILIGVATLALIIYKKESETRLLKEDLVELSKVKYGIFSVDQWKNIIESIITKKIEEFDFNELPRAEIKKRVQEMLYKVTGDLKTSFNEEKGFLPKAVAKITGIFDKLQDDVPEITETILEFVEDPDNRAAIKTFALNKLDALTDSTFSEIDYSMYDAVIEKHGCLEPDSVITNINASIESNKAETHPLKIALFILAGLAALILLTIKDLTKHEFFLLTLVTICFLVTGLLLPMIEIDARISEMKFSLLGEPIQFADQILYYKNKSILEVVQVMLIEKRADLMAVGFLVLLFSVLFPFAKLTASIIYVYAQKLRQSKFIKFLIFRTGKWSMADVMVIAIFMAFIGFSGILRDQLKVIEIDSANFDLLTTNASTLQIGFFTFLTFAVLGLLVSHKLQYSFKDAKKDVLEEQIENVEEDQEEEVEKTIGKKSKAVTTAEAKAKAKAMADRDAKAKAEAKAKAKK